MAQWVEQKGPEDTGGGFEPRYRLYFLNIYTGNCTKNLLISQTILGLGPNLFCDATFLKSTESTGREFKSQHKLFSHILFSKILPKYNFFKTSESTVSYEDFEP